MDRIAVNNSGLFNYEIVGQIIFGFYQPYSSGSRDDIDYSGLEVKNNRSYLDQRLDWDDESIDYEGYEDYEGYNEEDDDFGFWTCDICGGNQDTGCLYFDPSECPRRQ